MSIWRGKNGKRTVITKGTRQLHSPEDLSAVQDEIRSLLASARGSAEREGIRTQHAPTITVLIEVQLREADAEEEP